MAKRRGSSALKNFSRKDIAALKSVTSRAGYKIVDWHQFGQPPEPEGLAAIIHGGNGNLGTLVERLSPLETMKGLEILIRGIPKPDWVQVNAHLGQQNQF